MTGCYTPMPAGRPAETEQVLSTTASLLSALKDAETGQRGYLLTGRTDYLEPYNSALSVVRRNLEQLMRR